MERTEALATLRREYQTDYQKEIATYTSEQVRQQVASSVLGMANQSTQAIVQLLRG